MLDTRLKDNEFVAGDFYSLADIAIWPWAQNWLGQEQTIDDKPHFARWLDAIAARPAVVKGKALGAELRDRKKSREEELEAQKVMFGQKG